MTSIKKTEKKKKSKQLTLHSFLMSSEPRPGWAFFDKIKSDLMDIFSIVCVIFYTKLNSVALVRERTIPTERPPPVGEVSANFCG